MFIPQEQYPTKPKFNKKTNKQQINYEYIKYLYEINSVCICLSFLCSLFVFVTRILIVILILYKNKCKHSKTTPRFIHDLEEFL